MFPPQMQYALVLHTIVGVNLRTTDRGSRASHEALGPCLLFGVSGWRVRGFRAFGFIGVQGSASLKP